MRTVFWGFICLRFMYVIQMHRIYHQLVFTTGFCCLTEAWSICAFIWSVTVSNVPLSKLWFPNLINYSYVKKKIKPQKATLHSQMKDREVKFTLWKQKKKKSVDGFGPLNWWLSEIKTGKNIHAIPSA